MKEKNITKSFERLLSKGSHRGFITYEELGKSLGKRGSSVENLEKAIFIIFDNKISLVKKNLINNRKKRKNQSKKEPKKYLIKVMTQSECIFVKWVVSNCFQERERLP